MINNCMTSDVKPSANKVGVKSIANVNEDLLTSIDKTASIKTITACQQIECQVWARINIAEQQLYLYKDGNLLKTFQVTTGNSTHKTPTMNRRPSGPMFEIYTSKKYPGGDYMGLGNMPYVVFIKGGYAIHGTTEGNIKLLGNRVSHGCIRLHPDNAKVFYDLIIEVGIKNTWVTVEK